MVNIPLTVNDFSIISVLIAVVLLITQELLNPKYSNLNIVIDRNKMFNAGLVVIGIFLITLVLRVYNILITLEV